MFGWTCCICSRDFKKGYKSKAIERFKKLTFLQRKNISNHIKENSFFSVGISTVKEIEKLNILQASLLSMKRAIQSLTKKPDIVLIDGIFSPDINLKCKCYVKGDKKIKSISAASIIAKVYRDELMIKISKKYNKYSWEKILDMELSSTWTG